MSQEANAGGGLPAPAAAVAPLYDDEIAELQDRLQSCAANLVKNLGDVSGFFQGLNNCLKNRFWIDVYVLPIPKANVAKVAKVVSKNAYCKGFTKCLMTHLLHLLSRPCSEKARLSCTKFIAELFIHVRCRDPFFFCEMTADFVHVLSELVKIHDTFKEKEPGSTSLTYLWFNPPLRDITHKELKIRQFPVVFDNIIQCETLQFAMMEIVAQMDLSYNLNPNVMTDYWMLTCVYLETGNYDLKRISLDAIFNLICRKNIPDDLRWQEYLFKCLRDCFQLMLTGRLVDYKHLAALEASFSACLDSVFKRKECNNQYYLNLISLFQFCELFLEMVIKCGLSSITTYGLRQSVCEIILCMFSKFGKCDVYIKEKLLKSTSPALIQHCIPVCDPKFTSQCIIELIKEEVKLNHFKANQPILKEKRAKTVETSGSLFSSNESPSTNVNAASLSPSWALLQPKFQSILQNSRDGNLSDVAAVLSELQVVVTVGTVCSVSVKLPEKSELSKRHGRDLNWLGDESPAALGQICLELFCSRPDIQMFSIVVDVIAALLYAQDKFKLSEMWSQVTAIIALPWLQIAITCDDIHINNLRTLKRVSAEIAFHEHVELLRLCLWSLAVLPSDVAVNLRLLIFRAIMCGGDFAHQTMCMDVFPLMMQRLKHSKEEDMFEILRTAVTSLELTAEISLANNLGPIICTLSGRTSLGRPKLDKLREHNFVKSLTIKCPQCHSQDVGNNTERVLIDDAIVRPFLYLLAHSDTSVKLGVIESLKSIYHHVGVDPRLTCAFMEFMEDDNLRVRNAFVVCFPVCMLRVLDITAHQETIINKLGSAFQNASTSHIFKQDSIMQTIGYLGSAVDGDLLEVLMVILVENVIHSTNSQTSCAFLEVNRIANAKKISLQKLFVQFNAEITKSICEKLVTFENLSSEAVQKALVNVARTFQFCNTETLVSFVLRYALPYLVKGASDDSSALLQCFSSQVGISKLEIIRDHFKYIYAYLVCECECREMETALKFIESETDTKIIYFLRCDYLRVLTEVLLRLSTHPSQVYNGLVLLASRLDHTEIKNMQELADFLKTRLLGFLAIFDGQFQTSSVPMHDKKLVLQCLSDLIKLMGPKHITAVRMKVLATLRIALAFKEPELVQLTCNAWLAFVKTLDDTALGPLLSQIVVPLLPLVSTKPREIAEIFYYYIVEKRQVTKSYFKELHILPDIPELSKVNEILKADAERPITQDDCRKQLRHLSMTISCENLEVRIHAFIKLKHFLQNYKNTIYELVLGSESLDPAISELIKIMVISSRETDPRVRSLIGECLGELGAIDPGRLEMDTNDFSTDMSKVHLDVKEEDFAFALMQELTRAYLAADGPRIQDCSSFAIQELLQIYNCKPSDELTNCPTSLWRRFSTNIQEILEPLLKSKYVEAPSSKPDRSIPIYYGRDLTSYDEWVCTWCAYLVAQLKKGLAARIFPVCRTIIKHDFNTALFILPYVVLHVLLNEGESEQKEVLEEVLSVLKNQNVARNKSSDSSNLSLMSTQTVFSVMDFLKKWRQKSSTVKKNPNFNYCAIDNFFVKIPQAILVEASYRCNAYSRALMQCELDLEKTTEYPQSCFEALQKAYVSLNEPDAVAGLITCRKTEITLSEQIKVHESTGKYQDALACYQLAVQEEPHEITHYRGILNTFMSLGQSSTALNYANGVVATNSGWIETLNPFRIEAAWKLSSWDGLEKFLRTPSRPSSAVALGEVLLAAKKRHGLKFTKALTDARIGEMTPLSAAGMETYAYQRGYEHLIRLHMLNEVEKGMRVFLKFPSASCDEEVVETPAGLIRQWDMRFKSIQSTCRFMEPILSLRRVVFGLAKESLPELKTTLDHQIGQCWLQSAKAARKSGNIQHAYSCLLEASKFKVKETFVENAKWHWCKLEYEDAILSLQKGLREHYSQLEKPLNEETKLSYAKAKLLLVRYSDEAGRIESKHVLQMYEEVRVIYPEWEDAYFYLGQFCDKFYSKMEKSKNSEMLVKIVKNYSKCLQYGSHFTYHAMPHLLSVWLDLGAQTFECKKRNVAFRQMDATLGNINRLMMDNLNYLPPYKFLTALPQLVSRICHSHDAVFITLKAIIAKVLATYPQQAMWQLVAVLQSSYVTRVARCQEIIQAAKKLNPTHNKFFADVLELVRLLLNLSNIPPPKQGSKLSVSKECPAIASLLAEKNFSKIMLPLQSAMTVNLPFGNSDQFNHNPFSHTLIYIEKIEDKIDVMPSLQRPKKISLLASDGRIYAMMCKPKDDLRKDCRLMEFNAIVNKALNRDPEARRRELHIRTYTVVPLNESCGLLEWVPNLRTIRNIIVKLYNDKRILIDLKEMKALVPDQKASLEVKLDSFRKLLSHHPSVLSEWFHQSFLDPTAWYSVRLSYARTLAVMSMVGYILGLGDRHGENILLDNSNGDVVHVDFDCLFNKGDTFLWPEKVPFRLTRNLIDAMGVTGYEGVFRKACEVTMRVMRKHRETLMSVLKPFVHDPLVEWKKIEPGTRSSLPVGEIINEQAVSRVLDIERRLRGIVVTKSKPTGFPLSLEGQVDNLIKEATNEENLCEMYFGWAAFM